MRSDSEKKVIEENQKFIFLLISERKKFFVFRYSFSWNDNYFFVIFWSFSKIMEILVKNIIKTADDIKLFSAIFQKTYYGLYMCHFLWL